MISQEKLVCLDKAYPVVDGIVRVLNQEDVIGKNKRYQKLYDDFAPFYSFTQKCVEWYYRFINLFRKSQENA